MYMRLKNQGFRFGAICIHAFVSYFLGEKQTFTKFKTNKKFQTSLTCALQCSKGYKRLSNGSHLKLEVTGILK